MLDIATITDGIDFHKFKSSILNKNITSYYYTTNENKQFGFHILTEVTFEQVLNFSKLNFCYNTQIFNKMYVTHYDVVLNEKYVGVLNIHSNERMNNV